MVSDGAVEKHVGNIFTKLDLPPDDELNRRVLAVLAFLRVTSRVAAPPAWSAPTPATKAPRRRVDWGPGVQRQSDETRQGEPLRGRPNSLSYGAPGQPCVFARRRSRRPATSTFLRHASR